MKKKIALFLFLFTSWQSYAQINLIQNGNFELYWGNCPQPIHDEVDLNYSFDTLSYPNACVVTGWMNVYNYPLVYTKANTFDRSFPANWCARYIYPHSDSTCIGLALSALNSTSYYLRDYESVN